MARIRHTSASRPEAADIVTWAVAHRLLVGAAVFAAASALTLGDAVVEQRQYWALLALLAVPAVYLLRGRERLAALALVAGGIVLRLSVVGVWEADPVAVTVAAGEAALRGFNPYGHGYAASVPPDAPFPYGPLALVWGLPGQIVESAASVATMLLFVATGSWVTLGLYAADSFAVHSATQGVNDLSPGLLIAVAFLLLRRWPVLGGAVLAAAAALKPYAFAWFPAAIGYAGLPALAGLVGVSAVLWSPLLEWGVGGYVKSVAMARAIHYAPNALNIPELRVLGVPLAIAGLWARRWDMAIAMGTVVFIVVLFFDHWASKGYWLAVIPIVGIAFEAWAVRHAPAFVAYLRTMAAGRLAQPIADGAPVSLGLPMAERSQVAESRPVAERLHAQPLRAGESESSSVPDGRDAGPWRSGP